jgi:hypothetical protein
MSKRVAPELSTELSGPNSGGSSASSAAAHRAPKRRRRARGGRRAGKKDALFDVAFVVEELVRDVEAIDELIPSSSDVGCGLCGWCDSDDDCGGCGECFFGEADCQDCAADEREQTALAIKFIRRTLRKYPAQSAAAVREHRADFPGQPYRCPSLVRLAPHPAAAACACDCCASAPTPGVETLGCFERNCCHLHLGRAALARNVKAKAADRAERARQDAEDEAFGYGKPAVRARPPATAAPEIETDDCVSEPRDPFAMSSLCDPFCDLCG